MVSEGAMPRGYRDEVVRPSPLSYVFAMARIRSVGGIATVQGRRPDQIEPSPGAGDGIQINVRLFAKTGDGRLAIDPQPQTYLTAIPRMGMHRLDLQAVHGLLRAPEFLHPEREDRTQGPWGGVIEDLQRTFGIHTDAETLQALEFDVLMDAELRLALDELLGG